MKTFRILFAAASASVSVFAMAFLLYGRSEENHGPEATDLSTYSREDLKLYAQWTFAKLTAGNQPAWEDEAHGWRDQCDVGLIPGGCKPLSTDATPDLHFVHGLQIAPQTLIPFVAPATRTDSRPSSAEDLRTEGNRKSGTLLQTIYYNHSASRTIELNKLSDSGQLQQRLDRLNNSSAPLSDMTVSDFAPEAIVVKTFWEIIYGPSKDRYAHGAALFHKDLEFVDSKTGKYDQLSRWTSNDAEMLIDTEDKAACKSSVHEEKHLVYSLGCFEFRPVTDSEVSHISNRPTVYVPAFGEARYAILVGVHIMTRETPNWVWMTFWWNNERWDDLHASPTVQNKWQLFKANATVNNTDPVANPYLEGPRSGMYSNCLECHRHAVFHPGYGSGFNTSSSPPDGGDPVPRYARGIAGDDVWNPLQLSGNPPIPATNIPAGLRDLQSPSCYFGDALQTHFLWTIALKSDVQQDQAKDPCSETAAATAKK